MKICVLGAAGGIGQSLSLLLKSQLPASWNLTLYDLAPFTPGIGVDLSHIPTPAKTSWFTGNEIDQALKDSNIVIITAGIPRKPGMTRDDLFNSNALIVKSLMEAASIHAPNAFFEIVTNPLNSMVPLAAEILKRAGVYNPKRLFGVTTLDIIRANQFVSELKNLDVTKVNINVIGGHSGLTILPLLSQLKEVNFSEAEVKHLTKKIQDAGNEVVAAKNGAGSATLSTAYAIARFSLSLARCLSGESIIECAYVQSLDASDEFFSQPIKLGINGIEEVLPFGTLSDFEQSALTTLKEILDQNIQKGIQFANE